MKFGEFSLTGLTGVLVVVSLCFLANLLINTDPRELQIANSTSGQNQNPPAVAH